MRLPHPIANVIHRYTQAQYKSIIAVLGSHRSVRMPVSITHHWGGMAALDSYDEATSKTSKFRADYRFFIKDPRSSSEAQSLKPEWWFLLSRVEQKAAMKKIGSFLPNCTRPHVGKISGRWPRQV
jgi:hypothetical protein